jgi:hypothetical protein
LHRGVTQIRHFIDPAQFLQHLRADVRRLHFAPARLQLVNDFIHNLLEYHQAGRPLLKRFRDTAREFAPVERLVRPIAFDHAQA